MRVSTNRYMQDVLDEAASPSNVFAIDNPDERESDFDAWITNYQYTAGAIVHFYIKVQGGRIIRVRWRGSGHPYALGFASYLSRVVQGKTPQAALAITIESLETELGITWPDILIPFTRPIFNAMQNCVSMYIRNAASR